MRVKRKIFQLWNAQPKEYLHWYLLWVERNGRLLTRMMHELYGIQYEIEREKRKELRFDPVQNYYKSPIMVIAQAQGRYVNLYE